MKKVQSAEKSLARPPVTRTPKTAEIVATELRRRIIRRELEEGDSLPPESSLIDEFGISRPTMREAIRILETEQLVTVTRGAKGGARVHAPEIDLVGQYAGIYLQYQGATLNDVIEARRLIDPAAARLAAQRRPADTIAELHNLLIKMEEEIDDPAAYSHNAAMFHLKAVEGSGNKTLTLIASVINHIWEAHLLNVTGQGYSLRLAKIGLLSSQKLLKLIEQGKAAKAEKHALEHLEGSAALTMKQIGDKSLIEVLT